MCNDIPGGETCGEETLCSCKVAFWTQQTSTRLPDVECSVIPWSIFAIGSALQFFWECATHPYIHPTSRYITAHNQLYQAFPCVSTATDKHWGEKVGYEANFSEWVPNQSLYSPVFSDTYTYVPHNLGICAISRLHCTSRNCMPISRLLEIVQYICAIFEIAWA